MRKNKTTSSAPTSSGHLPQGRILKIPPWKGGWGDVLFGVFLFALALPAFAALPPSPDAMMVTLSPEKPAPNTSVTATLSLLNGGTLSGFTIEWLVNGVSVRKGVGETSASFRTGKLGTATKLTVRLTEAGEQMEKTLTILPASVVLIAESDGTAPPFYRGKSLFSYHGATRIAAIPFFANAKGARINPKTLKYTWKIADHVPDGSSGVGRDIFNFYAHVPFRPTEIDVEVMTADGSAVADGQIIAEAIAPQVILYEDHPLYGVLWNKALTNGATLQSPEIRITAQPFFFNKKDMPLLTYDWTLNGQPVGTASDDSLVFRKENTEGSAGISVEVKNPNAMFQFGEANTVINF